MVGVKQQINDLIKGRKSGDSIDEYSLIGEVYNFIDPIPDDLIEQNKSKLEFINNTHFLRLISANGSNCNIFISISTNNVVDIQVGLGGEYLYLHKMNDFSDVRKLRETLSDLFNNLIQETIIKTKNKICKAIYSIPYNSNGSSLDYKFTVQFSIAFIWQRKYIINNSYNPWLKL